MKLKMSVFGLILILAVSGCTSDANGSQETPGPSDTTDQHQVLACTEASILLTEATYEPSSKTVTMNVQNIGRTPLKLKAFLEYPDEDITSTESISIDAGGREAFVLGGVESDLQALTLKSVACEPPCYECPGAQDFFTKENIEGLS